MNILKSHFWYNKNQRNGILFLIILILILQLIYVFVGFSSDTQFDSDTSEIDSFQSQIDSLKKIKIENSKPKIFPFNPNYLTDFKAYKLGLSVEEIDKLFAYRKTGKFVNSTKEFQNITGINDSLLTVISPFFKFPEWVNTKKEKTIQKVNFLNQKIIKKDINLASEKDLQIINGIGEKLAKRIISYRDLLQGFTFNEQLYEVYYLDREVAGRVLNNFAVLQKPNIKKININQASFKEVLHLPYIDYKLTKKIFNYRNEVKVIEVIDELKKIDSFPLEKFDRIALYLVAE